MAFKNSTVATATTPQIVTLILDDSGSMKGEKANQATSAVQDMVLQMQAGSLTSKGFRHYLNIAKFGDYPTPIGVAVGPKEIDVQHVVLTGDSGKTDIPAALTWAAQALTQALTRCRSISGYREADSPVPMVVLFSDGANTGADVTASANALKAISHQAGPAEVVACGIGMDASDFPVMQAIASRPEFAINIDPALLEQFIAKVGLTSLNNGTAEDLVDATRGMLAQF